MAMCNEAKLIVELHFKNNSRLVLNTSAEADRPLGTEPFRPEHISSGCSLFAEIYQSYFNDPWGKEDDWVRFMPVFNQHEENAYSEIEKITDLTEVKEILIKEIFCWESGDRWTKNFVINKSNCPHINGTRTNTKRNINVKRNMPNGLTSIGKDAFYGCNNFAMNVQKDSYAHQYAQKHGIAYTLVD